MADTPALARCRDLCNGSKHLALNNSHCYGRMHMMQEFRDEGQTRVRMIAFERRGGTDFAYIGELASRRHRDSLAGFLSQPAGARAAYAEQAS